LKEGREGLLHGLIAFRGSLRVSLGDNPISLQGHDVRGVVEALAKGREPILLAFRGFNLHLEDRNWFDEVARGLKRPLELDDIIFEVGC
jgi:hypothetical protein